MRGLTPTRLLALLACMLAAACSPVVPGAGILPTPTPLPSAAAAATPAALPPAGFADGVSAVADGQALFVELQNNLTGAGNCRQIQINSLTYSFDGTQLSGVGMGAPPSNRSHIIAGYSSGVGGTAGKGAANGLMAVDTLPFTLAEGAPAVVLRAVTAGGALLAAVDGQPVPLAPGGSWESTTAWQIAEPWQDNGDCRMTRTVSLANHGLLDDANVDIGYWDGAAIQQFDPGAVQPPAPASD